MLDSVLEKGGATLGNNEDTEVKSSEDNDFYTDNEEKPKNVACFLHPPFKKSTGTAKTEVTPHKDD